MFGPLGFPEVLFIVAVALLIFGPKRLPELGRTIGRGLSEFRKASNELKRSINTELALEEESTTSRRPFADEAPRWPEVPAATFVDEPAPAPDPAAELLAPVEAVADPRTEPRTPLSFPSSPSTPSRP